MTGYVGAKRYGKCMIGPPTARSLRPVSAPADLPETEEINMQRSATPRRRHLRPRNLRRGSAALQAILIIPILLVVILAAFQFAVALVIEQAVSHAATVAAREAGKGADMDELECVINRVLSPHGITIGSCASFVLEDGDDPQDPPAQRGEWSCCPPTTPVVDEEEVRVTVCVELSQKPFLNALKWICIDFTGRTFKASSLVKKETAGLSDTSGATRGFGGDGADCGCDD